jgi:hypothetical protein
MPEIKPMGANPLAKHFRQPKLYIQLPSKGKYYGPNDLEVTENGEYPVYAMTARDEIAFKTPDALLNGQSTVDVIQSCMPNIKNAWAVPSIDIDTILIAIRIATFGDQMDITTVVPKIGESREYTVSLRELIDEVNQLEFVDSVVVGDMNIHIRPLSYREWTKTAIATFEEQRIFNVANNNEMDEEEKVAVFNRSFKKLTEITVGTIISSITSIEIDDQVVTEPMFIQQFVENADRDFYQTLSDHIDEQKKHFSVKPRTVITSDEDREKGAPDSFEMPIVFDQSHFFG